MHKSSRNWRRSAGMALMALAVSSWAMAVNEPGPAGDNAAKPPQVLVDAATEVSYLSFDRALPLFVQAGKVTTEGSADWQKAIFGQAVCLQQIAPATPDRLAAATKLYKVLIEKYPTGPCAPQSMMALGRIDELVDYLGDAPKRSAARQWYEMVRQTSGDASDLASEATFRIAATYIQEMDGDSVKKGISILTEWLKGHPKNALASAMWQYAGDSYLYPLVDYGQALDCYIKADAVGLLDKGREGPTYWRMANLADRVGRNDVAITFYTKIIEKTPTSGKAYEAQLALKRLGAPVPEIQLFRAGDKTQPATAPAGANLPTTQAQDLGAKGLEKP